MMYVRAALGMGGLTLTSPAQPWIYALQNFLLTFVIGMMKVPVINNSQLVGVVNRSRFSR